MNTELDMSQSDLFEGLTVFIHPSIPNILNLQLRALLQHHQAKISGPSNSNEHILRSILHKGSAHLRLVSNLKPAFDLEKTTHVITNSLHLPEFIALGESDQDRGDLLSFSYQSQNDQDGIIHRSVHLVTPLWVTQSYDLNKLQPTFAFSPDPYKFFSGIVVALDSDSNLPQPDVELIQACVQAWGGQFRRGLTKEVTHLICCDENTRDYKIADQVKAQLGLKIVLPHWFHHSVFFRKIISEIPFEFPSPSVLKPRDTSTNPDQQHGLDGIPGTRLGQVSSKHPVRKPIEEDSELELLSHQTATQMAFSAQNLSSRPVHQGLSDYLQETNPDSLESNQRQPTPLKSNRDSPAHREFQNKSVYLVSSLGLSLTARRTLARRIQELGANVFDSQDLISKQAEHEGINQAYLRGCLKAEEELIKSDIVICEYRVGWEFWVAWELNKTIGTLHWILCILNNLNSINSMIRPPTERLLDFPSPKDPIQGFDHPNLNPITISNYTGSTRSYLIRLIEKMHIGFSGSLDYQTAMVVAANKAGTKVDYATKRGIQIVNHHYIEECFQNWSKQSIQTHHLSFPEGVNLCESVGQLTRTIEGIHKWTKRSEVRDRRKLEMNQIPSRLIGDHTPVLNDPIILNTDLSAGNEIPQTTEVELANDKVSARSPELAQLNQPKSPISVHPPVSAKTTVVQRTDEHLSAENLECSSSIATTKTSLLQQQQEEEEEQEGENEQEAPLIQQIPKAKHVTRKPRLISNSTELSNSPVSRRVEEYPGPADNNSSPLPSINGLLGSENNDAPTPIKRKSPLKRSSDLALLDSDNHHHQSKKTKQNSVTLSDASLAQEKSGTIVTSLDRNQVEKHVEDEVSKEKDRVPRAMNTTEKQASIDLSNDETPTKVRSKKRSSSIIQTPRPESTNRKSESNNSVMTSGSSNTRTGSTRKAAQLALRNVKSAVEDMNLHQKESSKKSNKHRIVEDGGYFGKERKPQKNTSSPDLQARGSEEKKKKLNPKIDGFTKKDKNHHPSQGQPKEIPNHAISSSLTSQTDEDSSNDSDSISIQLPKKSTSTATTSSTSKRKMDTKGTLSLGKDKKVGSVDITNTQQKNKKRICITQSGERIPIKLQNKLIKMGAKFIDSTPTIDVQCTHLLTTKIARTEKFLSCILLGCFIVNHDWAIQSAKENQFLDEEEYELKDSEGEKLHEFKLKESINTVKKLHSTSPRSGGGRGGILNSFRFYLTPTVSKSNSNLVKRLILLAGGQILNKLPRIEELQRTTDLLLKQKDDEKVVGEKDFCLIISCKDDLKSLRNVLKPHHLHIKIFESGLVLEGLLVQEIKFDQKYEIAL